MIRSTPSLVALLSIAVAPLPVVAATTSTTSVTSIALVTSPAEEQLVEAKSLYQRGIAKFETADYRGAIDLWTEAYTIIPASSETMEIKSLLLYNIATARERAYEIDGELSGLRQALVLLDGYIESVDELYSDPDKAGQERAEATARRDTIAAQVEAAEKAAAPQEDPPPTEEPEPAPTETPAPAPAPAPTPTPDTSTPGRGLVVGGAVLIGVGVAGLGMMTGGFVLGSQANDLSTLEPSDLKGRRDQFARGNLGNTLAIAGGAIGGVSLLAGAVLLGVGLGKQRSAKRDSASVSPLLGPGLAGLSLRGRF